MSSIVRACKAVVSTHWKKHRDSGLKSQDKMAYLWKEYHVVLSEKIAMSMHGHDDFFFFFTKSEKIKGKQEPNIILK